MEEWRELLGELAVHLYKTSEVTEQAVDQLEMWLQGRPRYQRYTSYKPALQENVDTLSKDERDVLARYNDVTQLIDWLVEVDDSITLTMDFILGRVLKIPALDRAKYLENIEE